VNLARNLFGVAAAALVCACSGSTPSPAASGSVGVSSDVATLTNDGAVAHVTATVFDAQGNPATGNITFSATGGNLNSTGTTSASVALDATGHATVTYTCIFAVDPSHCGAGTVLVTASWSGVAGGTHVAISGVSAPGPGGPDAGTPPGTPDAGTITGPVGSPAAVIETAAVPEVLGLKGSGIQETGLMGFVVLDSAGRGVPGVTVNFGQRQPALVTLGRTTGVTGVDGTVSVDYSAGAEVGVTSINATVAGTAVTGSHAIAVRGAKPSASGFYFRCEKGNLPAYQTTPALETMTCEVRLSDRFGNRVGIPTPVRFATEAGAIDSYAVTQGFDAANPNDPLEGTATVTFTTDMGNGFRPADVDPLLAAPAQYPWPRLAEPQVLAGSITRNPRDQLVTMIAMTEGEEAFADANHNGLLDNNEVFYDLGDPFIDANDDGVYDQTYPNGPWEVRFCSNTSGTSCSTYNGPNGQWDSLTTIWVPTWVVFSDNAAPNTAPAGVAPPALAYSPVCVPENGASYASIYVFDEFLNSPAAGTTYTDPVINATQDPQPKLTLVKHGFFAEPDNWGAMGKLGLDFDYWPVLPGGAACAAPASPAAPTACVLRLFFRDFDDGFRGTIEADSAYSGGAGSCAAPRTFSTQIGVVNLNDVTLRGLQRGQYAL
jgi:hypothetical protein